MEKFVGLAILLAVGLVSGKLELENCGKSYFSTMFANITAGFTD